VDLYSCICVLGGDGTVHESINGYMEREDDARLRVPLAVIPGLYISYLFVNITISVCCHISCSRYRPLLHPTTLLLIFYLFTSINTLFVLPMHLHASTISFRLLDEVLHVFVSLMPTTPFNPFPQ